MSYEPTTWKDGDLVTSAKLNKIEQGIANSGSGNESNVVVIESQFDSEGNLVIPVKAKELYTIMKSGKIVFISGAAPSGSEYAFCYSLCQLYFANGVYIFYALAPHSSEEPLVLAGEEDDFPQQGYVPPDDSGGNNSGGGTNPR